MHIQSKNSFRLTKKATILSLAMFNLFACYAVCETAITMERSVEPIAFCPGKTIMVTITISKNDSETVSALGINETIPTDWSFDQLDSTVGTPLPLVHTKTGSIEFAYLQIPSFPITVRYSLKAGAINTSPGVIEGAVIYRYSATEYQSPTMITVIPCAQTFVPNLIGLTKDEAINALSNASLRYSTIPQFSPSIEEGKVISQTLVPGTQTNQGTLITFEVSLGPISDSFIRNFIGHTEAIHAVAFSPDGSKVLTGSGLIHICSGNDYEASTDDTAKLWDTTTGTNTRIFTGHLNIIRTVAFSPNGKKVLTGGGNCAQNEVKCWDITTGENIRTFPKFAEPVRSVAFSPDGSKILTSGGLVTLWDATMGNEIKSFQWSGYAAFSPDGSKILVGEGHRVRLVDIFSGEVLQTFEQDRWDVLAIAFSPDGSKVLTAGGPDSPQDRDPQYDLAVLWNASTGEKIRTFSGHAAPINAVAFSPDGNVLLTGSGGYGGTDNTAKLWDISTGAVIRSLTHTGPIHSVAFSPDGTKILTGSESHTPMLWSSGLDPFVIPPEGETDSEDPMVDALQTLLIHNFNSIDTNGNSQISYTEALAALPGLTYTVFSVFDANNNGQISTDEAETDTAGCSCKKKIVTSVAFKQCLDDLFILGLMAVSLLWFRRPSI